MIVELKTVTAAALSGSVVTGLLQAIEPSPLTMAHVIGLIGAGGIAGAAAALLVIGGYKEKVDRHDLTLDGKADAETINQRLERIERQLDALLLQHRADPSH